MLTLSVFAQVSTSEPKIKPVKITLIYPEIESDHQVKLSISTHTPIYNLAQTNEYKEAVIEAWRKGIFRINVPLTHQQQVAGLYLDIHELTNGNATKNTLHPQYLILNNYFAQSGDSVVIRIKRKKKFGEGGATIDNYNLDFKGVGSLKYKLRADIDSTKRSKNFATDYFNRDSTYNVWNADNMTAHELISTIAKQIGQLDQQAFQELKIHAIYSVKATEALLIRTAVRERFKDASSAVRRRLADSFDTNDTLQWSSFGSESIFNSYDFWAAELEKYHAMSLLKTGKSTIDSIPGSLKTIKNPAIREQLALLSTNYYSSLIMDYPQYLTKISALIYSVSGKNRMNDLLKISIGQPAYDFSLTDLHDKEVTLSQFKNKVIFMDFWYTGCGNCTNYYENVLSKLEEQFKGRSDIVFLSVSIDRNAAQWKKSVKSEKYTSARAVNLYTNGQGMANDAINYFSIHSFPTPIIIDKNQKIFRMGDTLRDKETLRSALLAASK